MVVFDKVAELLELLGSRSFDGKVAIRVSSRGFVLAGRAFLPATVLACRQSFTSWSDLVRPLTLISRYLSVQTRG